MQSADKFGHAFYEHEVWTCLLHCVYFLYSVHVPFLSFLDIETKPLTYWWLEVGTGLLQVSNNQVELTSIIAHKKSSKWI